MKYPICYIWIQLLTPYKCLWLLFKATWKIINLGLYVHKPDRLCWKQQITTTRGIIFLRPCGQDSDNVIFSPIINFKVNPPILFQWGEKKKKLQKSCHRDSPLHWTPEDSVAQSISSCIVLKFLVCFPQPLVAFWLLSRIFSCYFPRLIRLKNDWEEPVLEPLLKGTTQAFFFHFTTISHRVIKSRDGDSIHSRSGASKVKTRWHHWRCEPVSAMFLDHPGFWKLKGESLVTTRCYFLSNGHVRNPRFGSYLHFLVAVFG